MRIRVRNSRVEYVYRQMTPAQQQSVIQLWLEGGVLDKATALSRVKEVSTLIYDQQEQLVGVSTIYAGDFTVPNNPYFFFRMYIKPTARGSYPLMEKVTKVNYANLKKYCADQAHGLVIELENKKLDKLGTETSYVHKRGYTYYGKSVRGLQLWYVRFDDPKGIYVGL
ncbi:MAG: hypothetical protein C0620_02190 [Desulfuromonas sp.]|nr:MAG: hypothetical protein C0620_02190 [Desulfuromonas sp.]